MGEVQGGRRRDILCAVEYLAVSWPLFIKATLLPSHDSQHGGNWPWLRTTALKYRWTVWTYDERRWVQGTVSNSPLWRWEKTALSFLVRRLCAVGPQGVPFTDLRMHHPQSRAKPWLWNHSPSPGPQLWSGGPGEEKHCPGEGPFAFVITQSCSIVCLPSELIKTNGWFHTLTLFWNTSDHRKATLSQRQITK